MVGRIGNRTTSPRPIDRSDPAAPQPLAPITRPLIDRVPSDRIDTEPGHLARSIGVGFSPVLSRRRVLQGGLLSGGLLLAACDPRQTQPTLPTFQLTSAAFAAEAEIPLQFTCDGADQSPPLQWSDPPSATQGFTLILEDPDALNPPFIHWVLYDLPPDLRQLPAAIPAQPFLSIGGVQGKNDFGQYGYRGPCPPNQTHRYYFRLYATKQALDLPPGVTMAEVRQALEPQKIAEAVLIGRYRRSG